MKITGAIFDLDGTLVDSMKIWDVLPGKVVRSFGAVSYTHLDVYKRQVGRYRFRKDLIRTKTGQ